VPVASDPAGVAALAGAGVGATAQAPGVDDAGDPWLTGEYQAATTSSWPAPIGLSTGTPPPEPATSRTQSGLVKRARANGAVPADAGPGPGAAEAGPGAAPGAGPSGDLLAALRRHSANLQGIPGMAGQPPYGTPATARGPQAVPSGPESPPLPPTQRPTSGVYAPTGRHDRGLGDDGRQRPPAPGEPAARRPDLGGGRLPPPGAPGPDGPPGPVPPAPAPNSGPPLTRRVRGAQMPTTNPFSVPRTTGEHPAAAVAPGAPAPPPGEPVAEPPRQTRSADDVYSFLTSFTAGVQRGLDDTQPRGRSGEDNGSR
jgi:hypothetical protein